MKVCQFVPHVWFRMRLNAEAVRLLGSRYSEGGETTA
jgi:hypothetical protein